MSINFHRSSKRILNSLWFIVMIIAVLSVTTSPEASTPVSSPFTAAGQVDFAHAIEMSEDPEDIFLMGLAASSDANSDLFALRLTQVTRGWIPSWTLRATSEHADQDIELSVVNLRTQETVEWKISYDPTTGALALVLTDPSTNRTIATQTITLTEPSDTLYIAAAGPMTRIDPVYIPLAATSQVGTRGDDLNHFFTISRFETDETPWMHLSVPGPVPPGAFHLHIFDTTGELLTDMPLTLTGEELFVPLSEHVPVGSSQAVVTYTDESHVLWQQVHPVQVGSVATDFSRAIRETIDGPITTAINLYTSSELPPIQTTVHATLSELFWDPENKVYDAVPLGTPFELFSGEITLTAHEHVSIPLQFDPPKEPGTYRLTFHPTFEPDVSGHLTNAETHFTTYLPATIASDESYTIAIFPDTQIYAMRHPLIFFRQAEWLASQAQEMNIAFALHVGDITNNNTPAEWHVAANALRMLDHAVPYVLALGNHDYVPQGRPGGGQVYSRDDSIIHEYFQVEDFPHLAGTMMDSRLDNTYHLFSIGDTNYIVVSLEFAPSDEAIAWANEVIAAHPDHTAIVLTHQYLRADGSPVPRGSTAAQYEIAHDPTTSVNDGTDVWNKLVRQHANIEWVFSGHRLTPTIPRRVTLGLNGNLIYQLLINYQGEPEGGGGHLVLVTMHPDGTAEVRAYSPYEGVFKTDTDQYGFTNHLMIDRPTGRITPLEPPENTYH